MIPTLPRHHVRTGAEHHHLPRCARSAVLVVAALFTLSGCMLLVGRSVRVGIDEVQAMTAVSRIAERFPFVDFTQFFPDTYRFELSYDRAFDRAVRQLEREGEYIMKKDRKEGVIYTAAREAVISEKSRTDEIEEKIFYQYSIFFTRKSAGVTYITVYPTILKGRFQEVLSPLVRNTMRGVFFGSFVDGLYPEKKRIAMEIHQKRQQAKRKRAKKTKGHRAQAPTQAPAPAPKTSAVIHTVTAGETFAIIAKKRTGTTASYREIMEFNNITDPTSLKVGQEIRIPAALLKE